MTCHHSLFHRCSGYLQCTVCCVRDVIRKIRDLKRARFKNCQYRRFDRLSIIHYKRCYDSFPFVVLSCVYDGLITQQWGMRQILFNVGTNETSILTFATKCFTLTCSRRNISRFIDQTWENLVILYICMVVGFYAWCTGVAENALGCTKNCRHITYIEFVNCCSTTTEEYFVKCCMSL